MGDIFVGILNIIKAGGIVLINQIKKLKRHRH